MSKLLVQAVANRNISMREAGKIDRNLRKQGGKVSEKDLFLLVGYLNNKTISMDAKTRRKLEGIVGWGFKQIRTRFRTAGFLPKSVLKVGGRARFSFIQGSKYYRVALGDTLGKSRFICYDAVTGAVQYLTPAIKQIRSWYKSFGVYVSSIPSSAKHDAQRQKALPVSDALERMAYLHKYAKRPKGGILKTMFDYFVHGIKHVAGRALRGKAKKHFAITINGTKFIFQGAKPRPKDVVQIKAAINSFPRNFMRRMRELSDDFQKRRGSSKRDTPLNIVFFDGAKFKNYVLKTYPQAKGIKFVPRAAADNGIPHWLFLRLGLKNYKATVRHEFGHLFDYVAGVTFGYNYWSGVGQHYRAKIRRHKGKASMIGRVHSPYSGESASEWFAEVLRLMSAPKGFVNRTDNPFVGLSTIEELKAKDPVGYLVFYKFLDNLKKGHKKPEIAFSMTAFHEVAKHLKASGGKITNAMLKTWAQKKINPAAEKLVLEGDKLAKAGKHAQAIAKYRQALKRLPQYSYARLQIALCHLEQGKKAAATKELNGLLAKDKYYKKALYLKKAMGLLSEGDRLTKAGKHQQALKKYKLAFRLAPTYSRTRNRLTLCLIMVGPKISYKKEMASLEKTLK